MTLHPLLFDKALLGALASIITIAALIPYLIDVIRGNTKPHVFSWLIWGIATLVVFAAQWNDNAGAGSWATGISGIMTFVVIYLAFRNRSDNSITRSDWLCLATALSAIPLWYVTADALYAVVILIIIDALAYIPTFRKSWNRPHEEQMMMYILTTIRNVIMIMALEHYSAVTVLFPLVTSIINIILISYVFSRRAILQQQ